MKMPMKIVVLVLVSFVVVCDCLFQFQQHRLRNTNTNTNNVLRRSALFFPPLRCSVDGVSGQEQNNGDPNAGPKLDFLEDYYSVLEVDNAVDSKDLKRAYYKLVFRYHPDNIENDGDKELCNRQMMVINGAYRILKNPALRILYDKQRMRGLYGIKSGITERSDTSGKSSSSSSSTTPPKPPPKPQAKPPTKSSNADTNSAGFGGSWSKNDDAYNRDRDRERTQERERQAEYEESAYRRAERIRQERDREWEEAGGQPQPQRQRVDGYSNDDFASSVSSSSRSSNGRSDEPMRSSERHHGSNALDEVEEFLRNTGSRVSNELESLIASMKAKLTKLRVRKSELERSVYSDTRDWGEVTDKHMIKKRLMDITEIKMLNQQVTEMEEEIADIMLRGRTTGGSNTGGNNPNTIGSHPRTSRPAVDLWGEQTTGTRPREQSPYRGGSGDVNRPPPSPPPRRRRSLDSENWDKYFEEEEWGFRGDRSSSSSSINDLDKAMWRNRRGSHRGGSGSGGGGGGGRGGGGGVGEGGNQRASMSGGDIGNVGAVNIGEKLLRDDETDANKSSDMSMEKHNNCFETKSMNITESISAEKEYHAIHSNIRYDHIYRLFRKHILRQST